MNFLAGLALGVALFGGLETAVSSDKLYVNTSEKHYVMDKSREEGEKDLAELVKSGKLEEGWIFVDYKAGGRWYENGLDETGVTFFADPKPLKAIAKEAHRINALTFYQYHPEKTKYKFAMSETVSGLDLYPYLWILKVVRHYDISLLDKLDFRVVVPSGMYTVRFAKVILDNEPLFREVTDLINKLTGTRLDILEGKSKEFDYSYSNEKNFPELNRKFSKMFSNECMRIIFEER